MQVHAPAAELPPSTLNTPAEQAVARGCRWIDRQVARLTGGRCWFWWVGAAAVILSLFVQTPAPAGYTRFADGTISRVLAAQVEHPLSPLPLWQQRPDGTLSPVKDAAHLEKLAFRLTIPVLGKILGTGPASWTILSCLSGLTFFPLFAWAVARWMGDRLTAAYLTLAFGASWTGCYFFNDHVFGDCLAFLLLLAAVAFSQPAAIFAAVFAAAFVDERALLASGATLLFWYLGPPPGIASPKTSAGLPQRRAVLLAWVAYLAARVFLGEACGLTTGHRQLFTLQTLGEHLLTNIPYKALSVFKGLWVWMPLGLLGLLASRRWKEAAAYACIAGGLALVVLAVYDFVRSVAYLMVLLPVAFRVGGLSPANNLRLARLSFVIGLLVVTPWYTPLRYLFVLHGVRVDDIPLP